MIHLFLADIDGCLSEPYRAFDWEAFALLRDWGARAEADARVPRIGLCSGRAYAYVEATAQALALRAPALFESGGGRFSLGEARITWNAALTPAVERELDTARRYLLDTVVPLSPTVSFDYGKRSQAGIVSPIPGECDAFVPTVEAFVARELPDLVAYHTPFSIDVLPRALTKVRAIAALAADEGVGMANVAFVGDTNGDAEALAAVGWGFAVANASGPAKNAARTTTAAAGVAGVLEAYRACLAANGAAADAGLGVADGRESRTDAAIVAGSRQPGR